ncbi:orange carotenoid protein N-terminal domain-containing protein [Dendronalium sp. ChiSLP03b]|uniref:orange carotenoid protein N-terminal domain-containing protein n=1 Tax=Dendronalium sp. ChiSLP03b TaxID=3075381 RepID=UPI002AD453FC|nr:orange carotenoid protein N-terminal domain-containing protein [Dendronalium sp. ChiSLP03b]MDZ8207200.1 orange carotenoid protein N-terminal domain-containing protein [Dendronalium sp. ChiSLP03b]
MPFTIQSAQGIFPGTLVADVVPATIESFNQLKAEDQLALLWFAYTEMGKSITVAAIGAANMILAQGILEQIKQMPFEAQTQVMCDLANRADTPICRSYASFSMNLKLGFWFQLGEWMEQGIVAPIPEGYQLSPKAASVLEAIRQADSGQQITILRNTVVNMGFDPNAPGSYKKVSEPVAPPTAPALRTKVTIEGVTNTTVLAYINNMNAFDFDAAVALFTSEGALQPPFERPIVGQQAILAYMREQCQGLKMMPERGVSEPTEDGYTQVKVTGKVQSPWFGANVGMNIAWRFLLDPQGKIFFVAIDLLASPKELLNLVRK